MSDSSAFGFGKFIPGFDFLQNLAGAGQSAGSTPPFAHWMAPTLSVEEIDKRIEELKAVQFWLEQNNRALAASVQALQVQRMTLSTLQGMNVPLGDMAQTFPFASAPNPSPSSAGDAGLSQWPLHGAAAEPAATASAQVPPPSGDTQSASVGAALQWWGALTQQFQHIAQQALQDPAQQQAMAQATQMGTALAQSAMQTASDMVRQSVAKGAAAAAHAAAGRADTAARHTAKAHPPVAPAKTTSASRTRRTATAPKAATPDKKSPPAAAIPKASSTKKKVARKPAAR